MANVAMESSKKTTTNDGEEEQSVLFEIMEKVFYNVDLSKYILQFILCGNIQSGDILTLNIWMQTCKFNYGIYTSKINELKLFRDEMIAMGFIYDGEVTNGKKHGQGKIIYQNGNIYEGAWNDDMKDGHGKMAISEPKVHLLYQLYDYPCNVYEGAYKDGEKNGQGRYIFSDGDVYEGAF